jgi:hypothetical protein
LDAVLGGELVTKLVTRAGIEPATL